MSITETRAIQLLQLHPKPTVGPRRDETCLAMRKFGLTFFLLLASIPPYQTERPKQENPVLRWKVERA